MKNLIPRKPTPSTGKQRLLTPLMLLIKATKRRLHHVWSSRKRRRRVRRGKALATTCSISKIRIIRMRSNPGTQEGNKHKKLTCPINLTPRVVKRTKLQVTKIHSKPLRCCKARHQEPVCRSKATRWEEKPLCHWKQEIQETTKETAVVWWEGGTPTTPSEER